MNCRSLALFGAVFLAACDDTAQITQPEAAGSPLLSASAASAAGELTFQSVSAGQNHSCGVTAAGAAYCWGVNSKGALGDGTGGDGTHANNSNEPVAVLGGHAFLSVSAGERHTCGVTTAGAYCWGWSSGGSNVGKLGDGTNMDSNVPVAVSSGMTFQSLALIMT